ncbi:MAG: hypothetical protein NVSMB40_18360 [Aquirhabdus sp.]
MKNNELIAQFSIVQLIKWCFILLLIAAIFCLFWFVLNPYFVYFGIPKGVSTVIVACFIAIPWSWQAAVSNRKKKLLKAKEAFKRRNPDAEVIAEKPKNKYMALFWCACAATGLYFLIHGADQLDKVNQLNRARNQVDDALELDCAEKCAFYGIAQSDLIGPKIIYANTFEVHSGKQDYLFSWQSKKPAVQVTARFYNFDGQNWVEPQAIDLKWKGKQLPAVVPNNFEPHYTAIRPDFNEVLADEEPEIHNAYMRAKLGAPKMNGQVTVHMIINSFGQVTAANIDDSDLENPDFENNLIFIIKGLEFKSGEYATMEKNYTFNFK